jgi:hypothetical protein
MLEDLTAFMTKKFWQTILTTCKKIKKVGGPI